MKKILFALLTFAGILTSCTNDDIEITYATSIKVDPSSVLSTFTYERDPGELTMFDSKYKLRVTVLAYDESGMLVAEDVAYCENYNQISTSSINLPAGNYTIYAVTDVMNESIEYWRIEDIKQLSTTKVVDQGKVGGKNKILGVATSQFNVSAGKSNEFTLKPEAAGALCLVEWYNIKYYNDVVLYELTSTKTSNYIQFTQNSKAGYEASIESNNGKFDWRLSFIEPANYDKAYYRIYGYQFSLPMEKVAFRYEYNTETSKRNVLTDQVTVNLEKGGEYWFNIDMNDEEAGGGITYLCGMKINEASSAKPSNSMQKWFKNNDTNCAYLSDLAKTSK